MGRLFSFLSIIVGILLVIAIILGVIGWMAVPSMLSSQLSEKLQVRVKIEDVSLSYNKIGVNGVSIGNVPNGILPYAFTANTIAIETPIPKYFKKEIVIEEILIDNIYLGLEFDSPTGAKGNWTRIMQNLQNSQDISSKSPENTDRSVYIKKIILTNIKTDVLYRTKPKDVKHLPVIDRIELTDISSKGGFPTDQIMNSVLGQMLKSVFTEQNIKDMLDGLLQNPTSPVEKYLSPFKGLFNANETFTGPDAA